MFSESFSLGLKYLPSLLVDSAEDSDLTHFFGDLSLSEKFLVQSMLKLVVRSSIAYQTDLVFRAAECLLICQFFTDFLDSHTYHSISIVDKCCRQTIFLFLLQFELVLFV